MLFEMLIRILKYKMLYVYSNILSKEITAGIFHKMQECCKGHFCNLFIPA